MTERERIALRAAARIHDQLQLARNRRPALALPEAAWSDCEGLFRRIETAWRRGWDGAVESLLPRLESSLRHCRNRLNESIGQVAQASQPLPLPTQCDLYRDLLALHAEFATVRIDLREEVLGVTTEPVVFEHLDLGRFEIQLDLGRLGYDFPYEVEALEPRPAGSGEDITHPHVQDGRLCEGEGRVPIRRALREGRLFDFFLLVVQVLQTYNAGSAYVAVEHWEGVICEDCGGTVCEEDAHGCGRCGNRLCLECLVRCRDCDDPFCVGCLAECCACSDDYCRRCIGRCARCNADVCHECLINGKCEDCHDQARERSGRGGDAGDGVPLPTGHAAAAARTATDSAAESVRLEQTPLPAGPE